MDLESLSARLRFYSNPGEDGGARFLRYSFPGSRMLVDACLRLERRFDEFMQAGNPDSRGGQPLQRFVPIVDSEPNSIIFRTGCLESHRIVRQVLGRPDLELRAADIFPELRDPMDYSYFERGARRIQEINGNRPAIRVIGTVFPNYLEAVTVFTAIHREIERGNGQPKLGILWQQRPDMPQVFFGRGDNPAGDEVLGYHVPRPRFQMVMNRGRS